VVEGGGMGRRTVAVSKFENFQLDYINVSPMMLKQFRVNAVDPSNCCAIYLSPSPYQLARLNKGAKHWSPHKSAKVNKCVRIY
jgi:hypothetical protein